ncbi:MAG TPA: DUF1648 domain-containing protein [Lachnospiraceae bacterium]|nr:DUF1648 domain-containing protein [Lachnospiraceae bacterium]
MGKKFGKFEVSAIAILTVNIIVGLIMYFLLPDKIAIQWDGNEAINMMGKKNIFLFPLIALIFLLIGKTLLRLVMYKWFQKTNEMILSYLNMFLQILLLTCQLYTILFTYGLRITISLILVIELIICIIVGFKLKKAS